MRRAFLTSALVLVAGLALTSCAPSGSPTATPTPTASTSTSTEVGSDGPFPSVAGAFGEEPELEFPSAPPSPELQAAVLTPGDGPTVAAGDFLAVNVVSQVWAGDRLDSSYGRGAVTVPIGTGDVIPGWDAGLVGQRVGSRLVLTVPHELAYGEAGYADAGIPGSVTLTFVFDILGSYAKDVGGQADATVTPDAAGVVPVVRGDLGGTSSVSVPDGAAEPTEATTTVLARGSGEPAVGGDVIVQYAWSSWDNTEGRSTWVMGSPAVLRVEADGPFDGLAGVPLGSRVLLQVPADETNKAVAMVVDLVDQLPTTG